MNAQDYEQLTLFQEDSPVNLLVLPGSEEARMMTVTSGLKCLELYQNSSPVGSLAKMLLESSIWHSTLCYLTWKQKVTQGGAFIVPACAINAPHRRDRCAIVAYSMCNGSKTGPPDTQGWEERFAAEFINSSETMAHSEMRGQSGVESVWGETRRFGSGRGLGEWWTTEPELGRVANGIPRRVDRLKCLGNAVVPQQFYPFFAAIAEIERGSA